MHHQITQIHSISNPKEDSDYHLDTDIKNEFEDGQIQIHSNSIQPMLEYRIEEIVEWFDEFFRHRRTSKKRRTKSVKHKTSLSSKHISYHTMAVQQNRAQFSLYLSDNKVDGCYKG